MLFAREYLTWQRGKADAHDQRLRPWLPAGVDPKDAVDLRNAPKDQSVRGAWVYRTTPEGGDRSIITVLAEVITSEGDKQEPPRLVMLAVPMVRMPTGPAVADLPSFLPAPQVTQGDSPARAGSALPDENGEVLTLMQAFFKAFADGSDTRFFLTTGTKVTGFSPGLFALVRVPKVRILKQADATVVIADVVWKDLTAGAEFRQRYALDLVRRDRWLIKQLLVERGLGQ
ncbi:MAG TPA: conjugal transfer protein [Symbiobacteriaceae bacterium]